MFFFGTVGFSSKRQFWGEGREFFHPARRRGVIIRWGGNKCARTGGRGVWKSTRVGGYKIEGIPCFNPPTYTRDRKQLSDLGHRDFFWLVQTAVQYVPPPKFEWYSRCSTVVQ